MTARRDSPAPPQVAEMAENGNIPGLPQKLI